MVQKRLHEIVIVLMCTFFVYALKVFFFVITFNVLLTGATRKCWIDLRKRVFHLYNFYFAVLRMYRVFQNI